MDTELLLKNLIDEFDLQGLTEEEQGDIISSIADAIQKQFLTDVYDKVGKENFDALEASLSMGEAFYATTLKHLIPDYEDVFQASRAKIVKAYKDSAEGK